MLSGAAGKGTNLVNFDRSAGREEVDAKRVSIVARHSALGIPSRSPPDPCSGPDAVHALIRGSTCTGAVDKQRQNQRFTTTFISRDNNNVKT